MPVKFKGVILVTLGILGLVPVSYGDCITLIRGNIAMSVSSCGVLKPELTFDTSKGRYQFIRELPKDEQRKFWNSYRGMIVRGKVLKSYAIKSGLTTQKGVLAGEMISTFVPPGTSQYNCRQMSGKSIKAYLEQACCEGGGEPPCLLTSELMLKKIKVIAGKKLSQQGRSKKKSSAYKKGEELLRKRNYRKAAGYLARAKANGELDITGHYKLAVAYRKDDRCNKAIEPLEYINGRHNKKDFWADEEKVIRSARFLLARCYAKLNKPGFATTILEAYLLEPRKYRNELKWSLGHKDFGWIHTSKEYRDYKKEAQRRLGK